jgi:hypothetical protein
MLAVTIEKALRRGGQMNERIARVLAKACGGEYWQSGGNVWLLLIRRKDGRLVVVSGDAVCEYATDADFDAGRATNSVLLV